MQVLGSLCFKPEVSRGDYEREMTFLWAQSTKNCLFFSFYPLQVVPILITATNLCVLRDFEPYYFEVNLLANIERQEDYRRVESQNTWYHWDKKKTPAGIIYRLPGNDSASQWPLMRGGAKAKVYL